jgi:hypothetical protein
MASIYNVNKLKLNTMRTFMKRRPGFTLAILVILIGNLIGINALATGDGQSVTNDDAPKGVLVGYLPAVIEQKTGEHIEYWGWVGSPFVRLVNDYRYILCCKKTYRSMDGCKDLAICPQ